MTVDDSEVLGDITWLFRHQLNLTPPSPMSALLATGLLDTLGFAPLLPRLEQRFGVSIDVNELDPDDFRTLSPSRQIAMSMGFGVMGPWRRTTAYVHASPT